tara:strand:- start:357 stop:755 length:399 start_codon:yes stop_codon:yes gene_type:complete
MKSTKTLIFLTALLFASSCSKPDINLAHKTTQAVIRAETIEEARAVGSKAAEDAYNEYMETLGSDAALEKAADEKLPELFKILVSEAKAYRIKKEKIEAFNAGFSDFLESQMSGAVGGADYIWDKLFDGKLK